MSLLAIDLGGTKLAVGENGDCNRLSVVVRDREGVNNITTSLRHACQACYLIDDDVG